MTNSIELISNSDEKTKYIGSIIGKYCQINTLILLHGDLGVGKTCLTKGIALGCGIKQVVNSPTFNICKIYYGDKKLVHIDAYRLEGIDQDYGFEDEFDEAIVVVEWSEFVNFHYDYMINIDITRNDETQQRTILIESNDEYNLSLFKELKNI